MASAPRKPAPRLARPAVRYWKGKAPKGIDPAAAQSDSDDDDDEGDGEARDARDDEDEAIRDLDGIGGDGEAEGDGEGAGEEEEEEEGEARLPLRAAARERPVGMSVTLRDVNISTDGRVIVAGREESGRTAMEEDEESEEESDEETKPGAASGESSEEEESSEEDEPPKPQFRPVFVPKQVRATIQERQAETEETEEAIRKRELEAEERKKQSHDMVADSIRRELLEKETEEQTPDVDDTDGLDPEVEFEAWRLRELGRIKRDKESAMAREEERAEVERRRALPEEQRMKEDLEHAHKTRGEKPKGQQKFLQKYHHKGAFHQDLDILKKHDFTEATESTVDVSLLPKVMQVRNWGKRSQTKYTHLADQDTTATTGGFGGMGPGKPGGKPGDLGSAGGCFLCGGPHLKRDCPQNAPGMNGGPPGTGANGAAPGGAQREWGKSWRDRDGEEDGRSRGGWGGKVGDRERDRDRESGRPSNHTRDRDDSRDRDTRGGYGGRRRSRSRSPRDGYRDRDGDRDRNQSRERESTRKRYEDDDRRMRGKNGKGTEERERQRERRRSPERGGDWREDKRRRLD